MRNSNKASLLQIRPFRLTCFARVLFCCCPMLLLQMVVVLKTPFFSICIFLAIFLHRSFFYFFHSSAPSVNERFTYFLKKKKKETNPTPSVFHFRQFKFFIVVKKFDLEMLMNQHVLDLSDSEKSFFGIMLVCVWTGTR